MFTGRDLDDDLRGVRATHAEDALVFDCANGFETLDPQYLDDLATRVDGLEPLSYPDEWIPDGAPPILGRLAGPDPVIGFPEHGSVTWTRQTVPPVVLVRPRSRGSPDDFIDFLLAEAFVEIGADLPEHFLGFFEDRYRDLAAFPSPGEAYQLAAALYDAYVGLHTREAFAEWDDDYPRLHGAWHDAGERLEPRLDGLVAAVNRGDTGFADAAEYACSAVKHGLDLPAPFEALDGVAYREYGADYAARWAERIVGDDGSEDPETC